MDKNTNNDLLLLGISILIVGLSLASYSISTYSELKNLSEKIDFELIDDNHQISATDKYYKYLSFADFLNQRLNKNRNIPIKNASCTYLNYAQHNAIELYNLTSRDMNFEESKQNVAIGNIRTLYNILGNYKTCKQSESYKQELQNILDEAINRENKPVYSEDRMNRFLNGYDEDFVENNNSENFEEESETPLPKLDPIVEEDTISTPPKNY